MTRPLIWLALDGVGHPQDAPPGSAWEAHLPTLRPFVEAGAALDATLGVPGLPQSATGQAVWLTGVDAVALMGEHFGPQPGPTLRRLLDARALPVRLVAAGGRAALLNVYPPGYFEAQARRARHGCFPYSVLAAGLPLNPPGLPLLSPTLGLGYAEPWAAQDTLADWRARGRAVAGVRGYDLLMFDAWFGDVLGHLGREVPPVGLWGAAVAYLERLDALLAGLLEGGAAVVLSSDHGNFEDLGVKAHTVARVPFAVAGTGGLVTMGARSVLDGGQRLHEFFGV
ncbi:metalloenzyme domain protein [Deinococcus aquiradiocola]|uniref:Metalloenzyme domain protein n=1 Tax=Deinococcus aquiradiocola TaxID=393059 RepID=A0A917PSJ2_9DEIO|nr:metalloenzyme domain protein [Deinococcus aquiradiocola]GGJ89516.1 hypothetical protein GCM10008939_36860 [Deinococcus aquiradiocola]